MMEVATFASSATLAAVIWILICAWRVLNRVWLTPKRLEKCLRKAGFSGNSYTLFYGDIKEKIQMSIQSRQNSISLSDDIVPRLLPFHHHLVNKYGKNNFTWNGPMPVVNLIDPVQIKEIFSNIYEYPKPPIPSPFDLIATGLISSEGEKWARHRKIMNPAFHIEKLKKMMPAIYSSTSEIIAKWDELVSAKGSCELDVLPDIKKLTSDVISRTAFGSSYKEGKRVFELQEEQAGLAFNSMQLLLIPGWRFLPTKMNKRIKEVHNEIKFLLRELIDRRERAMKTGEVAHDDLVGIMLESKAQENDGNENVGMTTEDIIEECKAFYFAGQETTATLLVWTMILLGEHQEWQDRARSEVLQVFGKENPDFNGLSKLKTVTMILYEVLRLYPAVTYLVRTILKEKKLGKYPLPAGVRVSAQVLSLHHDTEIWGEDAKEFKPERFCEGISKATKGEHRISYLPFGLGPRICIGQNLALTEAKVALAMILQNNSFNLSPSYTHSPICRKTVAPEHGAHIILHKL